MSTIPDDQVAAIVLHPDTAKTLPVVQRAALMGLGVLLIESPHVPVGSMVKLSREMIASHLERRP